MSEYADFGEFIRALKDRNDIVEVVGSYLKLERRGYNYWACCPFHHEKTPSFSINANDKYYHCFGCGASGDVIGFIKEYENVDFNGAVEILAARAGMEVPARNREAAEAVAQKKKKRDRLLSLMRDSARFYFGNLRSGRASAHMEYLSKRGIPPGVIKSFGLGASLDYRSLPSYLLSAGYSKEECVESGACVLSEDGSLLDAEGGRLIIPIINNMDEVIAFGGRLIRSSDRAKYKNTRETVLFNKSKNLYNINLVKREKRAGGLASLIMVEGYMDAISLYAAGFRNVVASMGTSLTKEQARLCKRYTDTVFISYDGDFAGQKANLRGLDILKGEDVRVRVVPMPEGLDPDDVIRQKGKEGYQACLDQAMPLIDFRIHAIQNRYDLTKTDEVREFVREALAVVREAESVTEQEQLLKKISAVSGVSLGALARDLGEGAKRTEAPAFRYRSATGQQTAARFVLCACLLDKPYAKEFPLSELDWEDDTHRAVAEFVEEGRKQGGFRASGIFDLLPEDGELSKILDLDQGGLDGAEAEKYFKDSVSFLERRSLMAKLERERTNLGQARTWEEKREILLRIDGYVKKLKHIGGES